MSETVDELLEHARLLLDGHDVPGWPRATAVLLRQALEAAIDEVWRGIEPAMVDTSWRSKLIALAGYVPEDVALETASVWSALSAACHVHEYDLVPTAAELRRLAGDAARLVGVLTATSPTRESVERL